jgi:hypothetical protein
MTLYTEYSIVKMHNQRLIFDLNKKSHIKNNMGFLVLYQILLWKTGY